MEEKIFLSHSSEILAYPVAINARLIADPAMQL
jgi:hypothetical protein